MAGQRFEFDRYINGKLMAEGVTIERQANLAEAMCAAARIASKGPDGETPVLVLRATPPAPTPSAARERIAQVFDGWLAAYEHGDPIQYTPAREYAADAVRDCRDAVLNILALLPDEAAIRAAAFEEAAKIAEKHFVEAEEDTEHSIACKDIAAAIRDAGRRG